MHDRLIAEAKRQLIYANRSVNEIAYELGFRDPAYFSRFFPALRRGARQVQEAPAQFCLSQSLLKTGNEDRRPV
ncbi:MAG: helix-turn-helix domain-containing protein [Thiolinea sp.]